jgi:hypothetical protein
MKLGFTYRECVALRRISMTLRRWHERCCNEDIEEHDDGHATVTYHGGTRDGATYRIPNRRAGATRRLVAIMDRHPNVWSYVQPDPRGVALYVGPMTAYRTSPDRPRLCLSTWCHYHYNEHGVAIY